MNHRSHRSHCSLSGIFSSQFDFNENHSDSPQVTRTIHTGINYLPLPASQLIVVKPQQQSFDLLDQITKDFSHRFRYFTDEEFNEILRQTDRDRYKSLYQRLYETVRQSIVHCVQLTEEMTEMKHSLIYHEEILPLLTHNHQLAKQEKKILSNLVTKSWQRFDERLDQEIRHQSQIDQLKEEHRLVTKRKIEQEQYQSLCSKVDEIQMDITYFTREVQRLHDYRHHLNNQLREIHNQRSFSFNQLDLLQTHFIRIYTQELNNLQLEQNTLVTENTRLHSMLVEQIGKTDEILQSYRTSLDSFRLTLFELEQQTEVQLTHESSFNRIRSTLADDSQRLISILENQIEQKRNDNEQLLKTCNEFQEKIQQQREISLKKKNDLTTIDQLEKQIDQNLHFAREHWIRLKSERRTIEHQLKSLMKQNTNEDRFLQTLKERFESFAAQEKVESQRSNALVERLQPMIDDNRQLKIFVTQLSHQTMEMNQPQLIELREKLVELRQIHQECRRDENSFRLTQNNFRHLNEQYQMRFHRTTGRTNELLQRLNVYSQQERKNLESIQILEKQLTNEQHQYLQWTYQITEMKNQCETQRTKRQKISIQSQVMSNNIKHCQYRLKTFDEQLAVCREDFLEQEISMKKLREFYVALKQQDQINMKKFLRTQLQSVDRQYQYRLARQSLEETEEKLRQTNDRRAIFARLLVRRMNLCHFLYRHLSQSDRQIQRREQQIELLSKCIQSLIIQIRHHREQYRKLTEKQNFYRLETVRTHLTKILHHSYEKQFLLTQQIFQRRSTILQQNRFPPEDLVYLHSKFSVLKHRLFKVICRDIICHLALVAIEQDFVKLLKEFHSKSNRDQYETLRHVRTNLYQLMRRLKAKTAENNMLIDYRSYFQLIHTDTIIQLTQWTNFITNDVQ